MAMLATSSATNGQCSLGASRASMVPDRDFVCPMAGLSPSKPTTQLPPQFHAVSLTRTAKKICLWFQSAAQ
jgi:hypothetical protein